MKTSERLLPVKVDEKYGYINLRGEVAIPLQYDYASAFVGGFAEVRVDEDSEYRNAITFINTNGDVVGQIEMAQSFGRISEGLLSYEPTGQLFGVEKGTDGYGYLDMCAQIQIPPIYQGAGDFSDGIAIVSFDGRDGAINRVGDWVIQPRFDTLWPFQEGEQVTAFLTSEHGSSNGWGLIDREGNIVVKPKFGYLSLTNWGLTTAGVEARDEEQMKYGAINEKGSWLIPPTFHQLTDFNASGAGAALEDSSDEYEVPGGTMTRELWGVIDRQGNWIIEPNRDYAYASAFQEGLSKVYVGGRRGLDNGLWGGKYGFINLNGEMVIEPQFDYVSSFEDGVARVELHSDIEDTHPKRGYINEQGEYIWRPTR